MAELHNFMLDGERWSAALKRLGIETDNHHDWNNWTMALEKVADRIEMIEHLLKESADLSLMLAKEITRLNGLNPQ